MKQRTKTGIVGVILAFVLGVCTVLTAVRIPRYTAEAESATYTNVLEDLRKDSSFDTEHYPTNPGDTSLQVIQLAESADKELFVYVYQPSGAARNFKASSINISTTINDGVSFFNYKLEYLNSSGVFYKYLVKDLTVKDDAARYYVISSIFRPFDESIDKGASGGNTVTEVNYAVNRQYCFGEINGKPYVNCVEIETIVVTDKFVGFVRYPDGFKLYYGACDGHFVAFNTDKPIEKLLEADVYYTTQGYSWSFAVFVGESETFGEKQENYAYLKYTDKVEHNGGGLFAGTYTWDRIQSVEDFIAGENLETIYHGAVLDVKTSSKLTDEALAELKGKKWVLRFTETQYTATSGQNYANEYSTLVGDVTILRLKFETDGVTYNLGVIDNKQTGGKDPVNETETEVKPNNRWKTFLYLLAAILLIILFAPILPYLIRFAVWLLCLPFKAVAKLIRFFKKPK